MYLAAPRAVYLEFDGRRLPTSSTLSSPSSRVTYREKDNISAQCIIQGGNPPPRVYWFYSSINVTNSSQLMSDYLEEEKVYLTRSSLIIPNISRTDHNKTIVCIVEHETLPSGSISSTSSNGSPESIFLRAAAYFNIECK